VIRVQMIETPHCPECGNTDDDEIFSLSDRTQCCGERVVYGGECSDETCAHDGPTDTAVVDGVTVRYDARWVTWVAELDYYGAHNTDRSGTCADHPVAWVVEFCGSNRDGSATARADSRATALRIAENREAISAIVLQQARTPYETHTRLSVAFEGDQMTIAPYDRQTWTQTVQATA
jgi:hypothetical protein